MSSEPLERRATDRSASDSTLTFSHTYDTTRLTRTMIPKDGSDGLGTMTVFALVFFNTTHKGLEGGPISQNHMGFAIIGARGKELSHGKHGLFYEGVLFGETYFY